MVGPSTGAGTGTARPVPVMALPRSRPVAPTAPRTRPMMPHGKAMKWRRPVRSAGRNGSMQSGSPATTAVEFPPWRPVTVGQSIRGGRGLVAVVHGRLPAHDYPRGVVATSRVAHPGFCPFTCEFATYSVRVKRL